MTIAAHRRRAAALRAGRRRHDRDSSGHAATGTVADALLTTDWHPAKMQAAVRRVTVGPKGWTRRLVEAVSRVYPRAPYDRPREFRQFLAAWDGIPGRVVVRHRLVSATRVVRMRWNAPEIGDLADLAAFLELDGDALDWFADRRELNRHAREERLRHYRYLWLPHRLIEAPKPRLREHQRRVLARILGRVPVHDRVHGFVPGRGTHTFARTHTGRDLLISMDLRAFFTSITAARIYGLFRGIGYPEPVAHALTALTTTRTPAAVLRAAPDPHLAALLRQPHLPQGAPTSPALANLCAYRLDRRLSGLADRFGLTYGRYADDLAFSGTLSAPRVDRLVALTGRIAYEEGFRLHPHKTRVRTRSQRQALTGLVVNERPAVPREDYDRLRATLHNAATHGLAEANRDGHADFAAHLAGRVAWMSHRHPTRAAKLHRLLESALNAG
ncbi:reverse transcriptase family protein [Paractinoplanes lichenicola]|uniref:RNA-directed DNA polymerase n=1 Tax=Paractinoplanes lichenicola TaxID=2802976 RepID=A0ABS1VHI4_9ACTN|nr:reverse transcriptase family protein [Actinoplanes lichenicola]MBL7254169.1 RNA-directed DNA polymerase [Actinoplanes lichenicola]